MIEKILVLTRDEEMAGELRRYLTRGGVEVVDTISEEGGVHHQGLAARYNLIVIDKWFCGNARYTAAIVLGIRKGGFRFPILGVELAGGNGDVSHLQVAGCNFILQLSGLTKSAARDRIIEACTSINRQLDSALSDMGLSYL